MVAIFFMYRTTKTIIQATSQIRVNEGALRHAFACRVKIQVCQRAFQSMFIHLTVHNHMDNSTISSVYDLHNVELSYGERCIHF